MILNNSDEDEEITNKINNLLLNVEFKEYIPISSSDKRLLGGIALNKFNRLSEEEKLRNLDTLIIDPYYQPIIYNYPIYRANYFGAQIGLFAKISFTPQIGLLASQVFLINNDNQTEIFRDETYSNFEEVIIAIDDVLNNLAELIRLNVEMKIDEKLNELGIKTNEELNKLYTSISNAPSFVELFHESLEELLQKILKASGACFKKVYDESQKINETLEELEIAIDNNNIDFIKVIESKTESNIINFVLNIKEKFVNIYKKSQMILLNLIFVHFMILKIHYMK